MTDWSAGAQELWPPGTCCAIVEFEEDCPGPCGKPSLFIVSRSDGDENFGGGGGTEEACEEHLADAVIGMVDGDESIRAVVTIRWDKTEAATAAGGQWPMTDLNVDGPHSPGRTAEAGNLFDDCSRFIVYATMGEKRGLEYPGDAYRLIADLYSATGRLPQACEQIGQFLAGQAERAGAYEARGRHPGDQVDLAIVYLAEAAGAAHRLTTALQAAQTAIAGLGIREDGEAEGS